MMWTICSFQRSASQWIVHGSRTCCPSVRQTATCYPVFKVKMAAVSNPQGRSSFIFSTSPTLCGQVIATSLFNVAVNCWEIFWWSYMTHCGEYHMVFLIRVQNILGILLKWQMCILYLKHLDDEMVTFIIFGSCRYHACHGLFVHFNFMLSWGDRKSLASEDV